MPAPRRNGNEIETEEDKKELEERDRVERGSSPPHAERDRFGREPELEVYQEGHNMVIEDEEGNVLKTEDTSHLSPEEKTRHIEEQRNRLEHDKSGELQLLRVDLTRRPKEKRSRKPLKKRQSSVRRCSQEMD